MITSPIWLELLHLAHIDGEKRAQDARRVSGGGTYGEERSIAYNALRAAGYSETAANQALQEADLYFRSIGVTENTPTRIPGNRP